jgi:hypothetical protein
LMTYKYFNVNGKTKPKVLKQWFRMFWNKVKNSMLIIRLQN